MQVTLIEKPEPAPGFFQEPIHIGKSARDRTTSICGSKMEDDPCNDHVIFGAPDSCPTCGRELCKSCVEIRRQQLQGR